MLDRISNTFTAQLNHQLTRIQHVMRLRQNYPGARLTPRRLFNLFLSRHEYKTGRIKVRSLPVKLTVESTNVCNLRCPACFTGAGEIGRGRSMMTLELYRKLLAELGDHLLECEFHNWGEPLLSKFIYTMIREAVDRGISTGVSTNFSIPFDAERAEKLVASGLHVLGVSIDGARQETYEQYRVRGDLETVLKNCQLVVDAKRRLRSQTPRMVWEFHVFRHNVADIGLARTMARDLGMDIAVEKGWVVGPGWDAAGEWSFHADPAAARCTFLWQQAVVHNDGGVAPCCSTFYREDDVGRLSVKPGELGAATFREVWNNQKFREARGLFRARAGSAEARRSICFDCPVTVIWDNWQKHRAAGGAAETFQVGHSTNDMFNYFFGRRPSAPTVGRDAAHKRAHSASE
jgi:sulfatase maturation enzyme AslB (radical SAM superfamily)